MVVAHTLSCDAKVGDPLGSTNSDNHKSATLDNPEHLCGKEHVEMGGRPQKTDRSFPSPAETGGPRTDLPISCRTSMHRYMRSVT